MDSKQHDAPSIFGKPIGKMFEELHEEVDRIMHQDSPFGEFMKTASNKFSKTASEIRENITKSFGEDPFRNLFENKIRIVKNFPKQGVDFLDIQPLLSSPKEFRLACLHMLRDVDMSKIDAVVAIESRGFLFGTTIANIFDKELILARKKGKLPPPIMSESYLLEYGHDTIEIRPGIGRVVIIDDVLATGGTLKACVTLCEKAGYQVEGASVFIDMTHLHSSDVISVPLFSAIQMDGQPK